MHRRFVAVVSPTLQEVSNIDDIGFRYGRNRMPGLGGFMEYLQAAH